MSANDLLTPISAVTETDNSVLPNFCNPRTETDVTDVTDYLSVSNDEFLAGIFGPVSADSTHHPLVASIPGDPDGKSWRPFAWPCVTSDASLNWYFQPSLFEPNPSGQYRAQKGLARAVYCVALDDVGVKVPLDRIEACKPSWLLETSPGNYQAGYIFDAPVTDIQQADALKTALIDAGLSDAGATGGAVRWMRLPRALNGKAKYGSPSPACRLVEWNPGLHYSIAQLVDALQLESVASAKPKAGRKAAAIDRHAEEDIYQPRTAENAVIAALKVRGLYKQPLGSGKHDITCPWVHEHTDQTDHGSCYFEPAPLYSVGGFKCQHAHGDQYRIGALLEFLGVSSQSAKHKATIKIQAGELHRIVDAAERELAATGNYYQRGGLIVSVVTEGQTTAIKPVPQSALMRALSSVALWTRYNERREADVATDPPAKHVACLFDSERYEHLPLLNGLARQPYLRHDGTLATATGFDPGSGFFGVFDARRFDVPAKPSRDEAEAAMARLRALLGEFAFATKRDEAGALAAVLTAAIRPSLPVAPMFHINAPTAGSGKSYLTALIAMFAADSAPPASAFPTTDEECSKLLLAALLEAPAAVIFDNLTSDLYDFKTLCSAITEESIQGRVLGVSKTATVGTRALFLSSGNNVLPVRDMTRRTVTVTLDPCVENPATRNFHGDPLTALKQNRGAFVSLALTIVRAWIVSGEQMPMKSFASFGAWSQWVRAPLVWLGLPDPAESVFEQMAHDPDRETLGRLLHAWQERFRDSPVMVREAVKEAESSQGGDLHESMLEVAEQRGEINRLRLGKWINRHQGKVVDGLRFGRADGVTSSVRWCVQSVTSVSSGSVRQPAKSVRTESEVF